MSNADTKSLVIDEKAHGYAKIYASLLKDEFQRKRAYASIAALYSFINILEESPCEIQKSMTLFRNPQINEQYEISDLYVNKWHLDVRVVTGGDAVLVPKIHYDSNIVPDFYIVIKVDAGLKEAELIGIADTSSCSKETYDANYYCIPFNSLIDYETFLSKVKTQKLENYTESEHSLFTENYLCLMDNELDLQTKNKILNHLFKCSECRTEFCCFTGFEMVSCNAIKYPDIIEDQTLSIVGAQNVDNKEYEGKEENIYIGNDDEETEVQAQADAPEETVSDILDELFSVDDDFIETESATEKDIDTDLNIIEDKNDDELEIIEEDDSTKLSLVDDNIDMILDSDFTEETPSELEVLDKTQDNILDEEFVILEQPDDISIIDNSSSDNISEIEEIPNENSSSHGDYIQKVIVDYDDTGEPVYSYITNVSQDESNSKENSEIKEIEDINENSDFEEFPEKEDDENSSLDSNSEIENIDDEDLDNILDEEFEVYNDDNSDIQYEETSSDITPAEEETIEDNSDNISYIDEIEDIPVEEYQDNVETAENIEYNNNSEEFEDTQEFEDFELENESSENQENDNDEESVETYDSENSDEEQDLEEYEDEDDDEEEGEYDENLRQSSPKTLVILVSVFVLLGLIGGGAFLFMKGNKTNNIAENAGDNNVIEMQDQQNMNDMFEQVAEPSNEQLPSEENNNPENQQPDGNQPQYDANMQTTTPLTESDLLPPQKNTNDVGSSIANAFSPNASTVSFRGLNWFCASELFSDRTFKAYLQNLDNNLKQNLKTNILNATETPSQNTVSAKFAVDNNGNLKKVMISESCGSEQIDNIVLQSINESFVGEKSQILNDSTLKSDTYYLKVTIKL